MTPGKALADGFEEYREALACVAGKIRASDLLPGEPRQNDTGA